MSSKAKISKKTAKKKEPVDQAIAELLVAVKSAETDDKVGLVKSLIAAVTLEAKGRKRKLSREVAQRTLDDALDFYRAPDISAVPAEEILELIMLQDVFFKKSEGLFLRLSQPVKCGDDSLEVVTLTNPSVRTFIDLDINPTQLLRKGPELSELAALLPHIVGQPAEVTDNMAIADWNRIWGLFSCFFLGR